MANLNNLIIQIAESGRVLDYNNESDLGIKLNRVVEDFQKPTARYGEWAYTFKLPKTKNNDEIFEWPDAKGRTKIFIGKNFDARVYNNNNNNILSGIIQLNGIDADDYQCNFYSSFTQLVDAIGATNISDLSIVPILQVTGSTSREKIIINHINSDYKNSDEIAYQFPLVFYRTFFAPAILATDNNEKEILTLANPLASKAFLFNSYPDAAKKQNVFYWHQFPPAFYLVSILNALINNAGWQLGGNFTLSKDIKKIILPYTGDIPGDNPNYGVWDLNQYLPKIKCIDFLVGVINTFNLYITVDLDSKTLLLNDYDTLFASTSNAYDITDKVDKKTIIKQSELDYDVLLQFKTDDNNKQFGLISFSISPYINNWKSYPAVTGAPFNVIGCSAFPLDSPFDSRFSKYYTESITSDFFNKNSGSKTIQSIFGEPVMNSMELNNSRNINNLTYTGGTTTLYISVPAITQQTPFDSKNFPFSPETGSTFVDNSPDTMQYKGTPTMYFYYGRTKYDHIATKDDYLTNEQYVGKFSDWACINIATGGTITNPTFKRVQIPFASPFKLINNNIEREPVIQRLTNNYQNWISNSDDANTQVGLEIHALMMTYMMAGKISGTYDTTDFSLIFSESPDLLFPTIYSKYHKNKYQNIEEGYTFQATMRMDENDWKNMSISTPIQYDNEFYRLVSIKNYDPFNRTAQIELLKKV